MLREIGQLTGRDVLTEDILRLTVTVPKIASAAMPGQFIMLRIGKGCDPLLRRPFSIHQIVGDDSIQLVIKVVGKGTRLLADWQVGLDVDMIGPLGKGFQIEGQMPLCLVGGGMGVVPLLFLAKKMEQKFPRQRLAVVLGARTATEIKSLAASFNESGENLYISTDDGTLGFHGLVTDLLRNKFSDNPGGWRVAACGPYPMLKSLAAICHGLKWPCEVSLETIMACGMGACLGCVVPRTGPKSSGYAHVCTDGPVFDAEDVLWR